MKQLVLLTPKIGAKVNYPYVLNAMRKYIGDRLIEDDLGESAPALLLKEELSEDDKKNLSSMTDVLLTFISIEDANVLDGNYLTVTIV